MRKVLIDRLLRPLRNLAVMAVMVMAIASVTTSQDVKLSIRQTLDAGDTTAAVQMLLAEIKSDPGYHINHYALGRIYCAQGDHENGAAEFALALKRKSKHFQSLYHLGMCQLDMGDLDAAQKSMEQGRKKARGSRDRFENGYGLVMLKKELYQQADKAFRIALADNEAREQKLIKDLKNSPNTEEDRARLIDSIRSTHSRARAQYHLNLGDANFYSGVAPLAILEYEKALEVDTGSLDVYFHWAEACLSMKDYSCALEKLQVVLTKDSTHSAAWRNAGEIYFKAARSSRTRAERSARFRDAIGAYNKYLGLSEAQPDSAHVRVFFEVAMSYAAINGYDNAAENFEKVLAIPYEIRDIYFQYGKALCRTNDYVKASDLLLKHIDWVGRQDEKYQSNIRDEELYRLLGDSYFYRKPRAYMTATDYYKKSLEARPEQKRLLQNIAIAYHTTKSFVQALDYYDQRIALGIDTAQCSFFRNAGYCALNIAGGEADDDDFDFDDEDDEDYEAAADVPQADPDVNYFALSINYLNNYLECAPPDRKVVQLIATTYLYQLADCANGVAAFERLLAMDQSDCAANKAIGFAYFGGDICKTNYTKALGYLTKSYNCLSDGEGVCSDTDIPLWIAQCYHLRAVDQTDKVAASEDYKNAFKWYGRVLKCEPSHADAKKGQDDTRFEFN